MEEAYAEPTPAAGTEDDSSAGDVYLIPLLDVADRSVLAELGAGVAAARGLELIEEVPVFLIRREDLPAYLEAETSEADREARRSEGLIFRLLGVIGEDDSYGALLDGIFRGLVLGF